MIINHKLFFNDFKEIIKEYIPILAKYGFIINDFIQLYNGSIFQVYFINNKINIALIFVYESREDYIDIAFLPVKNNKIIDDYNSRVYFHEYAIKKGYRKKDISIYFAQEKIDLKNNNLSSKEYQKIFINGSIRFMEKYCKDLLLGLDKLY